MKREHINSNMKKYISAILLVVSTSSAFADVGYVEGKIKRVFAGNDNWYGVRFYLDITSNRTNGLCNPHFVFSEPEDLNGHKEKVAVFTTAFLSGKSVEMTVEPGRGGFCKLVEGYMY